MTTYESFMKEDLGGTSELKEDNMQYAGFWLRFWAYLVDMIVIISLQGILVGSLLPLNIQEISLFSLWSVSIIVSTIIYYAYFVCMTKFFQATLGKMVFGLKVVRKDGASIEWIDLLFREVVGRFIYNIAFGFKLLYLVVAFTKEKTGIHDMIGHTRVILIRP
ncbi:RDD family protein [Pseudogracilibacillus sp. ICA-222130]|uniref:RDD family protein n=1 Tax=Pseudogracilibacillus sp. ICA-222130 TaxID=3134655 RepID=UPI0030C40462